MLNLVSNNNNNVHIFLKQVLKYVAWRIMFLKYVLEEYVENNLQKKIILCIFILLKCVDALSIKNVPLNIRVLDEKCECKNFFWSTIYREILSEFNAADCIENEPIFFTGSVSI